MQSLEAIYLDFSNRLNWLDSIFTEWIVEQHPSRQRIDYLYLDGLISYSWQHWCRFCRRTVIASSVGCRTQSGLILTPCVTPSTWERVSWVSTKHGCPHKVVQHRTNSELRKEPTWGDVSVLQDVVAVLNPQNAGHLITVFGSVIRGPIHLQKVRNACAHLNHQTLQAVRALSPYYIASTIRHPCEVIFWEDSTHSDFAFLAWINEMRSIASLAIA